jgi:type II secretory pathway pseudopilin PulG
MIKASETLRDAASQPKERHATSLAIEIGLSSTANDHLISPQRAGITLIETLTVIAIVGILVALLLPAVQMARESARRIRCSSNLRQMALALHAYHEVHRRMPPAAIAISSPKVVSVCGTGASFLGINIVGESNRGKGSHGTSWMLRVLPYIEQGAVFDRWDFTTSVSGNRVTAESDVPMFYCPSRRKTVINRSIMFGQWSRGGNDYGGCIGACNGWHNCGANETWVVPDGRRGAGPCKGLFALQPSVRFADVMDGLSNTIMLGEVQRLDLGTDATTSRDGWAVGGVSTHFSTCSEECRGPNSKNFEEPGSHHPGGAQFAMADGVVQFISNAVSNSAFSVMGSMGQGDIDSGP